MHIFESKAGRFWVAGKTPVPAYSGFGEGKNNPLFQHVKNLGPIPAGAWLLGDVDDSHGECTIHLVHLYGETWGRFAFLIHGENAKHIGASSTGCIIAPRPQREQLAADHHRLLIVLPELPRIEAHPC